MELQIGPPDYRPRIIMSKESQFELRQALQFLGLVDSQDLDHFPDFLLIAPPKTGTTWLARQLRRHAGVYIPEIKEVKYFNLIRRYRDLNWYLSVFRPGAGKLKGDLTANYALLPRSTIRLIHALRPDLKLIYLMRDPVDRAWSHARFDYRCHDSAFFASDVKSIVDVPDKDWKTAFVNPGLVLCGDYLGQLERWLEVFDRRQVYIGFFEQIQRAPRDLLNSVFDFLGLATPARIDDEALAERVNAGVSKHLTPELGDCLRRIYGKRTKQFVNFVKQQIALDPPAEWIDTLTPPGGLRRGEPALAEFDDLCSRLARSADDRFLENLLSQAERAHPQIIDSQENWNIVKFRERFYGVPWSVGSFDFFDAAQMTSREIIRGATAQDVRKQIDEGVIPPTIELDQPQLVQENFGGYNLVNWKGTVYALAQSVGPVQLPDLSEEWYRERLATKECFRSSTLEGARRLVKASRTGLDLQAPQRKAG